MRSKFSFLLLVLTCITLLSACTSVPEGINVVKGVDANRYLGKWYEVARLENSFEQGLEKITAEYSLKDNGDIKVINRGFDIKDKKWKQAEGVAKFVVDKQLGQLKVSFFGPFYGGYNIIALDKTDYRYSMVAGNDRSYLWILSRTPSLSKATLDELIAQAKELGFPVDELIMVNQGQ